jgi:hypothetical protein
MRVALLGEQATGKSSYLVALYGALENHCAEPLKLERVLDEVGFLNRGLEAMMQEERVGRTDVDSEAALSIELTAPGGRVELHAPDRSGELLKAMINGRAWDPELLESLDALDGALLFVHVLRLDPGRTADEVAELLGQDRETGSEPAADDADPVPWSPSLMPGDVRIVDVLQAIMDRRSRPLPIAIVISAWDWVDPQTHHPAEWLETRAPLLSQFLANRHVEFPSAVFGVSAQGFDFRHASSASQDVRNMDPWQRASTVDSTGDPTGLGAPIAWLAEHQPLIDV